MQHDENKQGQKEKAIDMSKIGPALRAYIEARDALFAKYGKLSPDFKKAA